MDRRNFVISTAVGAMGLGASNLFSTIAEAAPVLDMSQIPSKDAVWADVKEMNALGARHCGNAAHLTFMKSLEDRLAALGMAINNLDHKSLLYWEPRNIAITAFSGEKLPVGACNRWSAVTGEAGVGGQLVYLGRCEGPSVFTLPLYPDQRSVIKIPDDIKGKIALVEVMANKRPLDILYPKSDIAYYFDADRHAPFPKTQGPNCGNHSVLPVDFEKNLKKAGAIGIIYAWSNIADADAQGRHQIGTTELPSLWVVPSTGAKLKKMAEAGQKVTLTVTAKVVPNAPTRTIVATLPGQSEESIILWTHTDGQNAIEENGGLAILNMMRYFVKLPKEQRERTLHVVASEGHMAEQYVPTSAWIRERPSLCEKAVALVSIEHLGCREWLSNPAANTYEPTGENVVAYTFCPTKAIQEAAIDAGKTQKMGRAVIINTDKHSVTPGMAAYRMAKVPVFGYISVPSYLECDSANGHIAKLSPDLFYDQMLMLTRLVRGLDATPKSVLRPAV